MLSTPRSGFSRKKMSTVDTAWLRMDSDGNLMMIVGVSMLSKPVSVEGLKHALESRFLVYKRFRSRVVSDVTGACRSATLATAFTSSDRRLPTGLRRDEPLS